MSTQKTPENEISASIGRACAEARARLNEKRKKAGKPALTLTAAAIAAGIGIRTYSRIEKGDAQPPTITVLAKVAAVLETTLSKLVKDCK